MEQIAIHTKLKLLAHENITNHVTYDNTVNVSDNDDDDVQGTAVQPKLASYVQVLSSLEDVLCFLETKGNSKAANELSKVIGQFTEQLQFNQSIDIKNVCAASVCNLHLVLVGIVKIWWDRYIR